MKKTISYIIAIALLLVVNLILFFRGNAPEEIEKNFFDAEFINDLKSISISYADERIYISKNDASWRLNDEYEADQSFVATLLSVFRRVEMRRSISGWEESVDGVVSLETFGGEQISFEFASNPTQTKSYFISESDVSEVVVPGYRDNVAGIFSLHPDQWRNRMVHDGSWRTIQKVRLNYASAKASFEIEFEDKFFLVNEQQPGDSTAVVDYLNLFQLFQANEMISKGRFPELDSLSQTAPMAKQFVEDIQLDQPIVLNIFPKLENQSYHLVIDQNNEMMVIDSRRITDLLRTPTDFGVR